MRVAYLVNHYPKVSHTFIRREILALERQGVEVIRLSVRGWADEAPDPQDQAEKARTRYLLQGGVAGLAAATLAALLASPGRWCSALALALRMGRRADRPWPVHLIYLAEACLALRWLRESGATHLHAHFGTNSAEVAMLAHALGGPRYSFTVHGSEEFDKPVAMHLREKIEGASFVAAVTSYCRSQLYRCVDWPHWRKIAVVHCGVESDFHEGAEVGTPEARRLICVGRLCEQKGHLLLLEATAQLINEGLGFELVLAGDGELRAAVEARIQQLGLQARVRITGWISSAQVRDEILASRAMVVSSFAEGLPVVLMEAMALRRPVLSTWITGIPELVRHGESGWLFPPGDVQALAQAMRDCLAESGEGLARLGDSARRTVLLRHDIDTEAAKLLTLFKEASQHA